MNNFKYIFAIATIATSILTGCAIGPNYERPELSIPEKFLAGGDLSATNRGAWFNGFNDPLLSGLLSTAATNNLTIQQTMQRIRASRATLSGTKADYWPNVGFSASASKTKSFDPDSTSERAGGGFDASWEPDLFGKTRRSVEAAQAELEATELSLADAKLTLDAEIAAEYVNLRLLQTQYEIATNNLALQESFHTIAKAKYEAGLSSELDSLSSESQVHATKATLPAAKAAIEGCIRRIEILLALNPGELDSVLKPVKPIPAAPEVALTVPSDLLRRRPDIRRAEKTYAASLARIGVSQAAYFPTISIGASANLSSDSFSDWGEAVKTIQVGPSIKWSILSFGRTKAQVEKAKATAEEAALVYRETVLKALHEVETEATALKADIARREPLAKARDTQKRALELSISMYEKDLGEYIDVISAQQSKLTHDRSVAEADANLALAKIALYKALGGNY